MLQPSRAALLKFPRYLTSEQVELVKSSRLDFALLEGIICGMYRSEEEQGAEKVDPKKNKELR